MGNLVHLHGDPHEQTLKLLPWYLNGTLDDGEAAMVEAHLVECADCSREAEAERALRDGVNSTGFDTDEGWAAMRARIETAEAGPAPVPKSIWRRQVGLGWVAGGALAASLAAMVLTTLPNARPDNVYHALGSAPNPAAARANAIILFAPETSTQAMRDALNGAGARITDGPLASGGYLVHMAPESRERVLAQLRSKTGVVMAEPIDSPAQP
jgi:anti-sigma factor RsiW